MKKTIDRDMISSLIKKSNEVEYTKIGNSSQTKNIVLPPRPTQSMLAFEQGLKHGETFVDERLLSINGWLAPNGNLYCCRWQEHDKIANYFDCALAIEMNMAGYIRLSQMRFMLNEISKKLVNEAHLTPIRNWHADNDLCIKRFEKDLEVLST